MLSENSEGNNRHLEHARETLHDGPHPFEHTGGSLKTCEDVEELPLIKLRGLRELKNMFKRKLYFLIWKLILVRCRK